MRCDKSGNRRLVKPIERDEREKDISEGVEMVCCL